MKAWTSGHTLRSFEFGALEFECCFHMEKTLKLGFVLRGVGLAFEAMRLRSLALVSGACGFVVRGSEASSGTVFCLRPEARNPTGFRFLGPLNPKPLWLREPGGARRGAAQPSRRRSGMMVGGFRLLRTFVAGTAWCR